MENQTQNECRCEKTSCGCANVKAERCQCGERCACKSACRCIGGCACKTAR
jgi:hypothetical protein